MTEKPLTKAALDALRWIAENEPVELRLRFYPSRAMTQRLKKLGLIEEAGPRQGLRTVKYQLSEQGRKAIS